VLKADLHFSCFDRHFYQQSKVLTAVSSGDLRVWPPFLPAIKGFDRHSYRLFLFASLMRSADVSNVGDSLQVLSTMWCTSIMLSPSWFSVCGVPPVINFQSLFMFIYLTKLISPQTKVLKAVPSGAQGYGAQCLPLAPICLPIVQEFPETEIRSKKGGSWIQNEKNVKRRGPILLPIDWYVSLPPFFLIGHYL